MLLQFRLKLHLNCPELFENSGNNSSIQTSSIYNHLYSQVPLENIQRYCYMVYSCLKIGQKLYCVIVYFIKLSFSLCEIAWNHHISLSYKYHKYIVFGLEIETCSTQKKEVWVKYQYLSNERFWHIISNAKL